MSAHTPTPWHAVKGIDQMVDPGTTVHHRDGWGVYSDADHHGDAQADAEFIVRACNSHDALVKALSDILSAKWTPEGISEELADAARAALTAAGAEVSHG